MPLTLLFCLVFLRGHAPIVNLSLSGYAFRHTRDMGRERCCDRKGVCYHVFFRYQ